MSPGVVLPDRPTQADYTAAVMPPLGLPERLFRYILTTGWRHQVALVVLTVAVFLLEVVPLELQRRVVNDVTKHRAYAAIVVLCGVYAGAVLIQGSMKLGLNVYRAWVGERVKRDLRRRIRSSYIPCAAVEADATAQGTAVSMIVAEVEPVGNFAGLSISEPLLQTGILVTVISYLVHIDVWMGAAALGLFAPQLVFVPLIQHAMNRRTETRIRLLRRIGARLIAYAGRGSPGLTGDAGIDHVFHLNMLIFKLKFSMNLLMNLCSHLQVVAALLLGGWWVLQGQLEVGGIVAFISGVGRLNDPWGDLINYFRELSVTLVKFRLLVDAARMPRPVPGATVWPDTSEGGEATDDQVHPGAHDRRR